MFKKIILISSLTISLFASSVILETNQGDIQLDLLDKEAPYATYNFKALVNSGYYNGVKFHRIIPGFMIQGGDPTATGRGGESIWKKPFPDEVKNRKESFNRIGVLAMANSGPNTNGSQFFITVKKTPWLTGKHTIFGYVHDQKSMNVVYSIVSQKRNSQNRPIEDQYIKKAYIKNNN